MRVSRPSASPWLALAVCAVAPSLAAPAPAKPAKISPYRLSSPLSLGPGIPLGLSHGVPSSPSSPFSLAVPDAISFKSSLRRRALAAIPYPKESSMFLRSFLSFGQEISGSPRNPEPLNAAFDSGPRTLPARDNFVQVPPGNAPPAPPGNPDSPHALYLKILGDSPSNLPSLDRAQMQSLWGAAFRHPVAGLDDPGKLARYDPDGFIGFCFGRAMTVHLLARRMGLAEESIRKLFIIGDLRSGAVPEWRFHVTTLVKGTDGRWHAIDPIFQEPLGSQTWIAAVQKGWDRRKLAKFYLVSASAVIPDVRQVPENPAQETGSHIIEISFDPSKHPGFTAAPELGGRAYSASHEASSKHFHLAGAETSTFDFAGIAINGQPIRYNGYFEDLLRMIAQDQNIARPADISRQAPRVEVLSSQPRIKARSLPPSHRPLGMNLEKLLEKP